MYIYRVFTTKETCTAFLLCCLFRCLEDQVKSQKSPQVEEGGGAMGMGKEAKLEGNAMMLQRLIAYYKDHFSWKNVFASK